MKKVLADYELVLDSLYQWLCRPLALLKDIILVLKIDSRLIAPNSRSILGFHNLHHSSIRVQNWGFYLVDPVGAVRIQGSRPRRGKTTAGKNRLYELNTYHGLEKAHVIRAEEP